ncbi:MAG: cystathionine gamma-synthase [Actinomycetota bacterium]|nr:cystathionine gamma-synthase [Actinomycetota bacterium]
MRFETKAIHVGQDPDPTTGAAVVPIYQTSTYVQQEVGEHKGFEYSRTGNPTRAALESCIASLESASFGLAFASGMAAEDAVLRLLSSGDHVVLGDDVYGGTRRLFDKVLVRFGLSFTSVDTTSLDDVRSAIQPNTKLIWIETPTNPYLRIADIEALSALGHEHDCLICVDNTFASPFLQRPLDLGADLVVHSTTKYLGGHSDVVGGAVCTKDKGLAETLYYLQNAVGAVPGAFDSWLVLRGIKTLGVRMRQHCENAMAVASFLLEHPIVEKVWYPGLPTHPGHEIATRQMDGFGGMVSFEVGSKAQALQIVSRTKVFFLAESLGGVESLIEHPAAMTHASIADSPFGVSDKLIRLSVGIEHPDDLIEDLKTALT